MPKYRQDELDSIQRAYLTGRELVDAGLLEDALPYFDQVLGRLPRRRRDRTYRIADSPAKRRQGAGVLWLPPVFRDALLAKAYCLNELGRFDDAFILLQRAIELDPENPQVYAELGFTHSSRDDVEMARLAYTRALDLEPENPAFLRALAHLAMLRNEFEEARDLVLRTLAKEPDSHDSLHQLAFIEYRLGHRDEAIRVLERVVQLAPEEMEGLRRLAGLLREVGRGREGITYVNAFLDAHPDDHDALELLADLLQQDGTPAELIAHASRLRSIDENDPVALDLLAWGAYQEGRLEDAYAMLQRLTLLDPLQPYHHFKLGIVCQALERFTQGMAAMLRAQALDSQHTAARTISEAIQNLDQIQIEHLFARARTDAAFRERLQRDPERTLAQSGYLLSGLGFQLLLSFDMQDDDAFANDVPARTVH